MTMAVSQSQASKLARLLARELINDGWSGDEPITVDMLSAIGRMRPSELTSDEWSLLAVLQQALDDWQK